MKRYAAYKPTGLKWFPEIPQEWNWRFLCQVAQEQTIKKPPEEMYPVMTLSYGEIKRKKTLIQVLYRPITIIIRCYIKETLSCV